MGPGRDHPIAFFRGHTHPRLPQTQGTFRLGLPEGVSLALGPGDEREIWGEEKPVITFRGWWNA